MTEESISKHIFINRYSEYGQRRANCRKNALQSPAFDMLKISEIFGLFEEVGSMLLGTRWFSKGQWGDIVWLKAWETENQNWEIRTNILRTTTYLRATMNSVSTMIWWQISDAFPKIMLACETLCKLICRASDLKCDSYLFKNNPLARPYYDLCNNLSIKNIEHILMHCPYFNDRREAMFRESNDLEEYYNSALITPLGNKLHVMLGKIPENTEPVMMLYFYRIIAINVQHM